MNSTNFELIETLLNIAVIFISFPENTLLLFAVMLMGVIYSWLKRRNRTN